MIYDSDVLLPQSFQIGDKPDHERQIFERTTPSQQRIPAVNLFAATIRWARFSSGFLYVEQLMTLEQDGKVTWPAPTPISIEADGQIIVAALPDSGAVATLDSSILSTDSSVTVTASVGTIPPSGFYRIDEEYGTYTFDLGVVSFTERGTFQTIAADQSMSATIKFSPTKGTVIPKLEFQSQRDNF